MASQRTICEQFCIARVSAELLNVKKTKFSATLSSPQSWQDQLIIKLNSLCSHCEERPVLQVRLRDQEGITHARGAE